MNKIKFGFNYHEILINLFQQRFPDKACTIWFSEDLKDARGSIGLTILPENGEEAEILIDATIPYIATIETLSHELAHLAIGDTHDDKEGHGKAWEEIHDWLHEEAVKIVEAAIAARIKANKEDHGRNDQ